MKLLKSILYIILSSGIGYLCWLIFYYLSPFLMELSWFWLITLLVVLGGLLIPLIGMLPGLLSALIIKLRSYHKIESIITGLVVVFWAFCSLKLAWTFDFEYEGKEIFAAITQNTIALGVFWGIFLSLVTTKNE